MGNLLPRQVQPVKHLSELLRRGQNTLDGSEMGTGKTFVAGGIIRELKLPTLVMAPLISLTSWKRMGQSLGTEFELLNSQAIQTGRTPYGTWENPRPKKLPVELYCKACQNVVTGDEPCIYHKGIHCIEVRKKPHNYGKFRWNPEIGLLVIDEAHQFGAGDSLNAEMAIAARRQKIRVHAMSGTIADSPLTLKAIGYILGLHTLTGENGFYRFAWRHGARRHPFGGLYFAGEESDRLAKMAVLHKEIFPSRGLRVRIADLGADFPECQVSCELYDIPKEKVEMLYASMDEAVSALNAGRDRDLELEITKLLRARQELELVMVPLYLEIARQEREAGRHVVFFVNFRPTVAALCEALKTDCRIEGEQSPKVRQQNIDRFQDDLEPHCVVNNNAGSACISLHDIRGRFPRTGIVSLSYSAIQVRQLLKRLHREGGKSKVIYRIPLIAGTVQERIHSAIVAKHNQIDALNDGDLAAANLPLLRRSFADIIPTEP